MYFGKELLQLFECISFRTTDSRIADAEQVCDLGLTSLLKEVPSDNCLLQFGQPVDGLIQFGPTFRFPECRSRVDRPFVCEDFPKNAFLAGK